MLALGRYWGKKRPELIRQLLREEDSVVVDPFGGAGTIAHEALVLGKGVIYSEINPYAWLIAYVTLAGAPRDEFLEVARNVLATAISIEGKVRRSVLPNDWLRYGHGNWFLKRRNGYRVSDFFPRENIRKLLAILRAIDEVDTSINTKLALYLAFSNALYLSSLMSRPNGGAWAVPSYWVGSVNKPLNAYEAFNRAVAKLGYLLHKPIEVCHSIGCGNVVLLLEDALRLRYKAEWTLIADPPFGDNIQYMELSFFYWAWLRISGLPKIMSRILGKNRITYPFSRELIINRKRGFTREHYLNKLGIFLMKTRVMKRKVLIFDGEDKLTRDVRKLIRRYWGDYKESVVRVDEFRRLGAGRGVTYLVFET
ncbi:MAG: hypothetical protein QW650_09515 [Thermofilum sp.]